jgi:hypothetical protein
VGCTPALPGARHARTPAPAPFPSPFADWCTKDGQQGNIVKSATGYVVRLLVDEPESRLFRIWCERNRNRVYIPEWLLKKWGITVDAIFGGARPRNNS